MSDALYRLIYLSSAVQKMDEAELADLLNQARTKNEKLDISGILLYSDGDFFQLLEGPEQKVKSLYEVIEKDPRHTDCIELIVEPIEEREFTSWSMAFRRMSRTEANEAVPGFSDLLERQCLEAEFCKRASEEMLTFLKTFRGESL
jgi:hypothetical protein